MAIQEFTTKQQRNHIVVVDESPTEDAAEILPELGGYILRRFEEEDFTDRRKLATTGAVVFQQSAQHPRRVLAKLEQYAATLLWHDCRVFVKPAPATANANGPAYRSMIVEKLNELRLPPSNLSREDEGLFGEWFESGAPPLTPCVHILDSRGNWSDIAVLLRNSPAGAPPLHDLRIDIDAVDADGKPLSLTAEREVLVRRAFSNCTSIRLVGLTNGLSGVRTFRAYAHLQNLDGAAGGEWPFLYFVKIGARETIAKEYSAYQANALELIPYHLGPRLRLDRCALGHLDGIIVSDYVSGAETLRDCARDGRAVAAIAHLFNSTLRAWRMNATAERWPLQEYLGEKMSLPMPDHREPLIRESGSTSSLEELRAMVMAADGEPVLVGVVHGDLHATNVLVRGNDAIVIDFEKVESRAPLLWDMACLEGGLFVDGFIGDCRNGREVLRSVECLYQKSAFEADLASCHPSDGSHWFFDCVRQIRMQARQIERVPRQYAQVLAVAFVRKACNREDFSKSDGPHPTGLRREAVRALAYLLAERILVGLSGDDSSQRTAE